MLIPTWRGPGWVNPAETGAGREANRIDDDEDGLIDDVRGWDWVGADADPGDLNGHGTHVAGIAGARADNGQGGRRELAHAADGLRVLGPDGTGTVADVVRPTATPRHRCPDRQRQPRVSVLFACRAGRDRRGPRCLFVVAAGNGGDDGIGDDTDRSPEYPCAYPLVNVVCVASTNRRDQLSAFSNYGARSVDLAAPGDRILSTGLGGELLLPERNLHGHAARCGRRRPASGRAA